MILTFSRVALRELRVSHERGWYCRLCSIGILNTECIVCPLILCAAVPVGANNKIVGSAGDSGLRSSLVHAPYTHFIKWLFPTPAPPVTNK